MVQLLLCFCLLLVSIDWTYAQADVGSGNMTALTVIERHSDVYDISEEVRDIGESIYWIDVHVNVKDRVAHKRLVEEQIPAPARVNSTFFVPQPVYISLTTMASRMPKINRTITSLIQARVMPTTIYLIISKEPYLLDEGVQQIPDELLCLVAEGYLHIIYSQNLGPHRKLLPALKRHWGEDVFIATVDDDMRRDQGYMILYQLLKHYVMAGGGERVVALRARRIALCAALPYRITKYYSWPVQLAYNREEMLIMPTGTGGILYKPSYFHKVVFHKSLRFATGTADDLMFRLSTMAKRVPVLLGCSLMRHRGQVIRECPEDEYDRKYDAQYGSYSSEFYKRLAEEITKQIQADVAAADAAKAAAQAAKKGKALRQLSEVGGQVGEGRGRQGVAQAGGRSQEGHRYEPRVTEVTNTEDSGCEAEEPDELALGRAVQLRAPHHHEQWGPNLSDLGDQATDFEHPDSAEGCHVEPSAVDDHPDHPDARRQLGRVKYRGVPRNGTEKDLFSINRKGGNDVAWKLAVEVLSMMKIMDIEEITAAFVGEREKFCYNKRRSVPMERFCALFDCDKPKRITVGNITMTQYVTANKRHRNLRQWSDEGRQHTLSEDLAQDLYP